VKEPYRQRCFQQRGGNGFATVLLGDLLHPAVVQDRIAVEENPREFVIEVFDAADNSVRTTRLSGRGVPVTVADRARELGLALLMLVER
jgi:hypothetical protein